MALEAPVVCFGEILWDIFPDKKRIGGAPLNVALRLQSLGISSVIASSIGKDTMGTALLNYLIEQKNEAELIQQSPTLPTGTVDVHLDAKGSASYTIVHPVAWDAIECTPALVASVEKSPLFLYGSLAARSSVTAATLTRLLNHAKYAVFDVNLRSPHYTHKHLETLMHAADLIKFNDEEIAEICSALGGPENGLESQITFLAKHTNTSSICVTLGAQGALMWHQEQWYRQPGFPTEVVDTVGAGDSFLATLLAGILTQTPLEDALANACAMGALVAGKAGANPEIDLTTLDSLRKKQG